MTPTNRPPSTAFIGAGAVASVLARGMREAGYPIAGVISRTKAPAEALAADVGAPLASSDVEKLPGEARWILLCVPDDAIEEVARQLSAVEHPWEECVVAHTAGALTAGVLKPLAERGAAVASMHPVQTFTRASRPDVLKGVLVTLEGAERATAALSEMVKALGGRPVTVTAADRPRLHLAAAIASNFLVTLLSAAHEVLARTALSDEEARAFLRPLLERTLQNVFDASPEEALTGPIERGDLETLRRHARLVDEEVPALGPLFEEMARQTVQLARRSGSLSAEQARRLTALFEQELPESPPESSSRH